MNLKKATYEKMKYSDPSFPLTFHDSALSKYTTGFYSHWHEHIEILFVTSGTITVTLNNRQVTANEGEAIVINSNVMHAIAKKEIYCCYHCLILDKHFCDSVSIPITKIRFTEHIADENVGVTMNEIAYQMQQKEGFYKAVVQSKAIALLVYLAQNYANQCAASEENSGKEQLARHMIEFLNANYKEPITIDDVADEVGFSKYYCCHAFKEVTAQTVLDYINRLRCTEARRLICSGQQNINESAMKCGFNNLSYFTKTYKRYFGCLPSQDMKISRENAG